MYISSLTLYNFRNYIDLTIPFGKEGAVFVGENGAGKTNILEAIHLLSIGRSQRGALKRDMIHTDAQEAYVEGLFEDCDASFSVSFGFSRNRKLVLRKNKQKVATLSELLFNTTIISFGSQDIVLIFGEPSDRRRFVDSILCQVDAAYLEHLILYKRNLLQRNTLLKRGLQDKTIDIYEEKMAEYGAAVVIARRKFFIDISLSVSHIFRDIGLKKETGSIKYKPSVPTENDGETNEDLRNIYIRELHERRKKDIVLGFTSSGPHRDDFKCYLNALPIKSFGSQGQCRAMALSIRLCALNYLEEHKPGRSIILVDDAFTELDNTRRYTISSLVEGRGQLFITAFSEKDVLVDTIPAFVVKNNAIASL